MIKESFLEFENLLGLSNAHPKLRQVAGPTLRASANKNSLSPSRNIRAQVSIFVIIAIVVVVGIIAYFLLRGGVGDKVPAEMQGVYDYYLSCVEEHSRQGIALLGEQGGYIYVDEMDFVPGSQYMPFSSQLDFFGQPIPYWMYVSGNNILYEQVPTESSMEKELERYVEERLSYCDFSDFNVQGFDVLVEEGDVSVEINDLNVDVSLNNDLKIYFDENSAVVSSHEVGVDSKLGKFFGLAKDVYDYEKEEMFLEKYGIDVMRLYAPVDGVELGCSPKVFVDEVIRQDIVEGLEANVPFMKLEGNYYDLANKENDYFVTDIGVNIDENVNFVYSGDWPTRIEIYGEKVIEPVGMQEGLGILGFCYVPYHLVYDIDFPVLIQFWDNEEVFQFPMSVVIEKNQERDELPSVSGEIFDSEVCKYKNQDVLVYTYDAQLNGVEANVRFKCLNTECRIGETEFSGGDAVLNAKMPMCVNGFVLANAEGYAPAKFQISTNEETTANVILNKLYDLDVSVNNKNDPALISFKSEDYSTTLMYPETKNVKLIEGLYNVTVYVYKDSSLKFPEISRKECVQVPKGGIGGLFGLEEEKCIDVVIPEIEVELAVVGGGEGIDYFTEEMLGGGKMLISTQILKTPSNIEELQDNFREIENGFVEVSF